MTRVGLEEGGGGWRHTGESTSKSGKYCVSKLRRGLKQSLYMILILSFFVLFFSLFKPRLPTFYI